jgi:two-component system, NtrC family, sensor kinase
MKRRGTAGSRSAKGRGAFGPRARKAPHAPEVTGTSTEEFDRLRRELSESLAQQAATADVLKVISRSTFNLQTVLDTLVESSSRVCNAYDSIIFLRKGDKLNATAHYGPISLDFVDWPIDRGWVSGRAFIDRASVHVEDVQQAREFPVAKEMSQRLGFRTALSVPLLREDEAIGVITIRRSEVQPFTEKQIELVKTFADQAVIAIENVRLFEAEQQRTAELAESLEQQTATSEILQVISNSLKDTQPVFDAIVQSGLKLFPGALVSVVLRYGDYVDAAAVAAPDPARVEAWRRAFSRAPLAGSYMHGAALLDRKMIDIPDAANAPAEFVAGIQNFLTSGNRAITIMPMMRGDEAIGLLSVVRLVAGPLSDKQHAVLRTFANQAVIAIENTRLLNELRESLEQQTATSEVLKAISSFPGELAPVFDTMLENAVRICEAKFGNLFLLEGNDYRTVAVQGEQGYADFWRANPVISAEDAAGIPIDRVHKTGSLLHILDMREDPAYLARNKRIVALVEKAGARSFLMVPLLKDNDYVGAIAMYRLEVRPFDDKEIALVQNFAAQAVIAIENARLLSELRQRTEDLSESLQQQTAPRRYSRRSAARPSICKPCCTRSPSRRGGFACLNRPISICSKENPIASRQAAAFRRKGRPCSSSMQSFPAATRSSRESRLMA